MQQKLTGTLRQLWLPVPFADLLLSSTGRDFKPTVVLTVNDQVDKLITQATSLENLSQCFIGWVSGPSLPLPSPQPRPMKLTSAPFPYSVRSGDGGAYVR